MTDVDMAGSSKDDGGHKHRLPPTLWLVLALGALFTFLNLRWPIARNAICYAKASLGIIQNRFDLFAVAHNRAWTAGKPIFFSVLAAPFVRWFGINVGMIIASFLGTAFFVTMAALAFPRLNKPTAANPRLQSLGLMLLMLNPLAVYQFWSAYPDSLFAALVLLSFILIDIIATEPERDARWHIVGLGATIFVAIHTKLYGAALLGMCGIYLLLHLRSFFRRSKYLTAKLALLVLCAAVLIGVLLAAKCGFYPLLDFSEGAGFPSYMDGLFHGKFAAIAASLKMLAFSLALTFQVSLVFLFQRPARREWALAPTIFIGIYILGLLSFPGTGYNMRYYLPAFAFLAPELAARAESCSVPLRRVILGTYGAVALLLVLVFNFAPLQRVFAPSIAMAAKKHSHINLWLDNLRLPAQIAIRKQIDVVNEQIPVGSVVYWSANYYGTATHDLAEHLGVKKGLNIRYVLEDSEIEPQDQPVFVIEFTAEAPPEQLRQAPDGANVTSIGLGVFRLDWISPRPSTAAIRTID